MKNDYYIKRRIVMKVNMKDKQHDFPKKIGDMNLAWYQQGRICVSRKQTPRTLQKQNMSIIQINQMTKALWQTLHPHFKKDLAFYALQYKKDYPGLRKRGISSYAVFLMIVNALIKRFSIAYENQKKCMIIIETLLSTLSVRRSVQLRLLKPVKACYKLIHCAGHSSDDSPTEFCDIITHDYDQKQGSSVQHSGFI